MTVSAISQALDAARDKELSLAEWSYFGGRGMWPWFKRDVVAHHYLLNLRPLLIWQQTLWKSLL